MPKKCFVLLELGLGCRVIVILDLGLGCKVSGCGFRAREREAGLLLRTGGLGRWRYQHGHCPHDCAKPLHNPNSGSYNK